MNFAYFTFHQSLPESAFKASKFYQMVEDHGHNEHGVEVAQQH